MSYIVCFRCFEQFNATEAHFKCPDHDDQPFPASRSFLLQGARINAPCPMCWKLTGFRACPRSNCHADLPYHAGRSPQQIIAVVGRPNAGKTLYLWSLLFQMREILPRRPDSDLPAAMFEDDRSFRIYRDWCGEVMGRHRVPESTRVRTAKQDIDPIIIRLLRNLDGRRITTNLVFYDPAGELLDSIDNASYLRYLEHAAGIMYLVEPASTSRRAEQERGLGNIVRHLEQIPRRVRPKILSVVLTKSDTCNLSGTAGKPCREALANMGYTNLLSTANNYFRTTECFAVSSVGNALAADSRTFRVVPTPVEVERPLLWMLQTLG